MSRESRPSAMQDLYDAEWAKLVAEFKAELNKRIHGTKEEA